MDQTYRKDIIHRQHSPQRHNSGDDLLLSTELHIENISIFAIVDHLEPSSRGRKITDAQKLTSCRYFGLKP